jgi:hypothetical protein
MAGKTPPDAVHNFLEPLQLALSCVSQEVLTVRSGYYPSATPHALTLGNSPAILGRDRRLALKVVQYYRIIEHERARRPRKVRTVGYNYTVEGAGGAGRKYSPIIGTRPKGPPFRSRISISIKGLGPCERRCERPISRRDVWPATYNFSVFSGLRQSSIGSPHVDL